jgi:uncharacterized protein (TIGR00299 family) protein
MKIAYFDCFAGASGDMILGALIHAGLSSDELRAGLEALRLSGWTLNVRRVAKNGLAATSVEVQSERGLVERKLADIEAILGKSGLPESDRERSLSIFRRLAEAEAKVHGTSSNEVHFHEVGAVDAIIDIVGAVIGLRLLGIEDVRVSPLPLGRGFVSTAHGQLPLPAPAVVELLRDVPTFGIELEGETVTPTGAAILSTLASTYGPLPALTIHSIGYGAGQRETEHPNVLRVLIGETDLAREAVGFETEWLILLETNVDDLNPQVYDHVITRLFGAGALDVWLTPIQMKKNRPAVLISTLSSLAAEATLTEILFRETTTLGLRRQMIERRRLPREVREVQTRFGLARVKVAIENGHPLRAVPEYEDCKRLAESNGVPLREVLAEVERAAQEL